MVYSVTTRHGKKVRTYKKYVDVVTRHASTGLVVPLAVCWPNGKTYHIDEVLKVCAPWPDCRGHWEVRYTIRLGNHETYLYLEQEIRDKDSDEIAKERWWVMACEHSEK